MGLSKSEQLRRNKLLKEDFKKALENEYPTKIEMATALVESHKLLVHYAKLLNEYDGGKRNIPATVKEWIGRCVEPEKRRG